MKKNIKIIALILIIGSALIYLISTFIVNRKKGLLYCDTSEISIDVSLERFDKDFRAFQNKEHQSHALEMLNEYGDFYQAYNHQIIKIGGIESSSYVNFVNTFLNDYAVTEAYKAIDDVFENTDNLDEEIYSAFKIFKCHFPDLDIPRVIAFNGGFNQSIVTMENFVGVGLDKYLGEDNYLYDMLEIRMFAKREMNPERIPVDVIRAYAKMEFPYNDSVDFLINRMIYNGKILLLLDACFPHLSDMEKINYDEYQMAYSRNFERDMWSYLINQKLLFSTDHLNIRKFTENAPFTSDFGNDSPPRTGNYLGWQIVRSFMKNNRDVSLNELFSITDYQIILNKSGYQP